MKKKKSFIDDMILETNIQCTTVDNNNLLHTKEGIFNSKTFEI